MKLPLKDTHKGFYDIYSNKIAIVMGTMQPRFVFAMIATIVAAGHGH